MLWLDDTLGALSCQPSIGYGAQQVQAAEPTAIATLALAAHELSAAATRAAESLALLQQQDSGAVAVLANEREPNWPTSLAIVAWCAVSSSMYRENIDRGIGWLLANRGKAIPNSFYFAHDSELIGWAYAEQTHSWVEPTAFGVLALKAAGRANHAATREGVAVLIDRQLPGGGLNYGNTYVLGQLIRSHVEPTGIALLALAGESDPSNRLAKSIAWLRRNIGPETTPLSLAWALLGLKAHNVELPEADGWLAVAAQRVQSRDRSPHKLALLALAAKGWHV
jgi:hypothetical protein